MNNPIFDYYKEASKLLGATADNSDANFSQAAYSLYWFFCENSFEDLNSLTKCFFDPQNNHSELKFGEALPLNIENYFLKDISPNPSQRKAIETALTNAVSFIQGPPGTGKTATILNLVSCILAMNKTVAVVSGNNAAIQTIEEKAELQSCGTKLAKLGSSKKRELFNVLQRYPKRFVAKCIRCKDVNIFREKSICAEDFLKEFPFITSTIHSLKKCFADGASYQYDYVIIDETSQVDCIAGIVAMSAAKHLVLIGDEEQLPPVIDTGKLKKIRTDLSSVPERYILRENKSFLRLCMEIFAEHSVSVLLNEHYRCHPKIIGFCNEYIYDNQLEIKTRISDDSRDITPIKVWWFRGNYCEQCYCGDNRRSKRNMKQVRIFIEKEWEPMSQRLTGDNPPSVCILTPFRGQLEAIKNAIKQYNKEKKITIETQLSVPEDIQNDSEDLDYSMPMLTVHKSQGKEFDIVYFLPVEDGDWEFPWSQHKRLVNVAVSRAKKELRIISSAQIMSEDMQIELTGTYIPPSVGKGVGSKVVEADQRFTRKLLDYAYKNRPSESLQGGEEYGFENADIPSIFDVKPEILNERVQNRKKGNENKAEYSPEIIVRNVILSLPEFRDNSLKLYRNILIKDLRLNDKDKADVSQLSEAEKGYYYRGCQIDFLICKDDKVVAAIEVDGKVHRFENSKKKHEKQQNYDEMKNCIMKKCFGGIPFIRLSDDGSSTNEETVISNAIKQGTDQLAGKISYSYNVMPITALIREYKKDGIDININELRKILVDNKYLEVEENTTKTYRPKYEKKFSGIATGVGFNKNDEIYEVPYYTRRAMYEIKKLLEGNCK